MSAMQTDLQSGSPAGPLYGESLGNPLGSYLVKRFGVFAPGLEDYKGSLPKPRLNRVREYIEQHLDDLVDFVSVDPISRPPQYFAPIGFLHPPESNQSSQNPKPS